ncbi:hypothetical protein LUZ61_017384 [Rhynchospora tenuis]|uniref:Replication factor A C-terminal domain-containing protein n=1 Tax=Rhynchospora tenuis TaxID=198213 RepID=A0AAD5Z7D4_9POAL|nr:hypothetical protein LUZ61_017384 [Rhynchospora tenuis]
MGEKIQGTIPVPDYQRVSNIFSEENVCEISRFTVEGSTIDYQVIKHAYMLCLTRQTLITALPPNLYDIPRNYFQFGSFDDLGVRITHLKPVTDVIARLVGFGDVFEKNTGPQPARVQGMYLTDNRGKIVEVALWGDYINRFNIPELFERSKQGPMIIACNSLQLKYWRGVYGLKTYSGTRFFMDPSIKEIADYLAVKLTQNNTGTWCGNCNVRRMNAFPWFRIRVQIVDHTSSAQFVLLGRLGEAAVGMTAQALATFQQQGNNKPDHLMAIVGKKYLFTVAGKQRTGSQENRTYTVLNMLEVPPEMLALLPRPVLDTEVGDLLATSETLEEDSLDTPAKASVLATTSPDIPAGNLLTNPSAPGGTATLEDDRKDVRGKRYLKEHMKNPISFFHNPLSTYC